jgi:hypothetical protein
MARTQPNETREVTDSNSRVEFVLDVRCETFGSPRCEAAPHTRTSCCPVAPRDQGDSEQHRRTLNASLGHATVGVQCDGGGSQKARQRVAAILPVAFREVFIRDMGAWCDVGRGTPPT